MFLIYKTFFVNNNNYNINNNSDVNQKADIRWTNLWINYIMINKIFIDIKI